LSIGLALHKALDFFFCDRCITECEMPGRGIPAYWFLKLIDTLCPIQHLFKLLPEEPHKSVRRIYFPRSWIDGSDYCEGNGIRT